MNDRDEHPPPPTHTHTLNVTAEAPFSAPTRPTKNKALLADNPPLCYPGRSPAQGPLIKNRIPSGKRREQIDDPTLDPPWWIEIKRIEFRSVRQEQSPPKLTQEMLTHIRCIDNLLSQGPQSGRFGTSVTTRGHTVRVSAGTQSQWELNTRALSASPFLPRTKGLCYLSELIHS